MHLLLRMNGHIVLLENANIVVGMTSYILTRGNEKKTEIVKAQ